MTKIKSVFDIVPTESTFEITHPGTDEPVGIRVTIMSPDDPRMKPIKRKITDFNLQKQKRGKTLKAVEMEDNEIALLAATLTGWEWYGETACLQDGSKPDFTEKNVIYTLKNLHFFRQQLNDQLNDEKGFF